MRAPGLLTLLLLLSACPKPGSGGGGASPATSPNRCHVDLAATGLFAQEGAGAVARRIDSDAQLPGGQTATGRVGDVLLENGVVRVVIDQPGRLVGPTPYGGGVVDADLARPEGEPGRDQFGRMSLAYALGRVSRVTDVEIVSDGSQGGPAVVAASGVDVPHDLINPEIMVRTQLGFDVDFVVDPNQPLPLRVTTYYVLSPGESRLRMLTAFCNDGELGVSMPLIELVDFRGAVELFSPGGCANALGTGDCLVDTSRWVGAQGDGVAYGLRSYSFADPTAPVTDNATLIYGGVVGSVIAARDINGVLAWTDPEARSRPGAFSIRAAGQHSYLRDLVIARDIAGVSSSFLSLDKTPTGTLEVTSREVAGAVAPGARVAVVDAVTDQMVTLVETDAQAKGAVALPPGTYRLSAAKQGHLPGPPVELTVEAGQTQPAAVTLSASRTLTVQVTDPFGGPLPAKVTVRCADGACPFSAGTWARHLLLEGVPGGAAAVGFVPVSGQLDLTLPPGAYDVFVSRGPEYSLWPDTFPLGHRVDLSAANQSVDAVLGRVVDSGGWMSADLHVHAINSPDSVVPNEVRVHSFLAEGVDVLISTDHEFITDYAPVLRALGAEPWMTSMIGEEVTSFSHGHFNTFPALHQPDLPNGGAFDHAGGEGPTLRLGPLFSGIKESFPGAFVQINHPRGGGGALTQLRVDTATLATHADPEIFRMEPAPGATASDTGLFSDGFDGLEVANGGSPSWDVVNDWMTFLSRGTVRTATGVSDTHKAISSVGGYSRTWARVGVDGPSQITPTVFAEAVRNRHAVVSNGPFLVVTARKVDAADQPVGASVGIGDTLSIAPSANEGVELVVEVQAPEWMQFDRIELYTHAPGREAVNGESNSSWPEDRILDRVVLDPAALTIEPVPGDTGIPLRRVRVSHRFVQRPTRDAWYVVMVRSVGSGRTLSPLHTSRPFAIANAILIDADGSGAYDTFPLPFSQPLRTPPEASPGASPSGPRVPTAEELEHALRELLHLDAH